jgi:phosphoadenosine phosphosulfate reductase
MVLTDLILRAELPIKVFTLETGRLHAETLGMIDRIRETYAVELALYKPEAAAVDAYVAANGLNAFYDSIEMRKECCRIRKVEPLKRALAGNKAWITGQRRAQSTTRSELAVQEDDSAHGLQKFNPLADSFGFFAVYPSGISNGIPVSSLTSRDAASAIVSPASTFPFGKSQKPSRWMHRIFPPGSETTPPAA